MTKELLHIKQPYLVAGWKYGWNRDGYKQIGVGIKLDLLIDDGYLDMKIGESKHIWRLDKKKALKFIEKYESYYNTSMGTSLGVVSWDEKLFTKIINEEKNLFVQDKQL